METIALLEKKTIDATPESIYELSRYQSMGAKVHEEWLLKGYLDQTHPRTVVAINTDFMNANPKQVEKFILRDAFRDMLPDEIANREKLRFAMGVGTDDIMDEIISEKIDPKEIKERPKSAYGLPFATFKELYYYDEFLRLFPPAYEKQTVRWDPFK